MNSRQIIGKYKFKNILKVYVYNIRDVWIYDAFKIEKNIIIRNKVERQHGTEKILEKHCLIQIWWGHQPTDSGN